MSNRHFPETSLRVGRATRNDYDAVLHLLTHSQRSFAAFGQEDLLPLLDDGDFLAAREGRTLTALLCASLNTARWAFVRGVAVREGHSADAALAVLLPALRERLRTQGACGLAVYITTPWLGPVLHRAGFEHGEWIVSLQRAARTLEVPAPPGIARRAALAPDLPALLQLDSAAFQPMYQFSRREMVEVMLMCDGFFLAETGAAVVGYVGVHVLGDMAHIPRLAVHPQRQGQGIGRFLLDQALAHCQTFGARTVRLNTQASNATSLALYEGMGFRPTGPRISLLVYPLEG